MVKRLLISLLFLIPVVIIAQIDWSKQIKNVPAYVSNALPDPGANGIVKRTAANTSAVAVAGTDYQAAGNYLVDPGANGVLKRTALNTTAVAAGTDVWPGTLPYSSLTSVPNLVVGPATTTSGYIPEWNNTTGTLLQAGINPAGAWPGTLPFSSLTAIPSLTWNNVTPTSGWGNYGVPNFEGLQYALGQFGIVYLRGLIAPGTVTDGTQVGLLPAAAWPNTNWVYGAQVTNNKSCQVTVQSNGQILIYGYPATGGVYLTLNFQWTTN